MEQDYFSKFDVIYISSLQKPFTISLSKKYFGIKKFGLKANEGSMIRNTITNELFRSMNVKSQRSSFSNLFINGIYMGLYWMSEEINQDYIDSRFNLKNGNLYKVQLNGKLEYVGSGRPDDYKKLSVDFFGWTRVNVYQHKLGKNQPFNDLANFINFLNETNDEEFERRINNIFDIEKFLRFLIVECSTGQQDQYNLNHKNYFLYNKEKFEFITNDFKLGFLRTWIAGDYNEWHHINIFKWGDFKYIPTNINKKRILTSRILNNINFRKRYSELWKMYLDKIWFKDGPIMKRVNEIIEYLSPYVIKDFIWRFGNVQRNPDNVSRFWNSSIKEYIEKRAQSAKEQLWLELNKQ